MFFWVWRGYTNNPKDGSYFKVQATHLPTSGEEVQWHAFYYNGEHYEVVIKQEL